MIILGKVVKVAATESQPLHQILCRFLRSYRATPRSTTGIAPGIALFSQHIRVRLLEMKHLRVQNDDKPRNNYIVQKRKSGNMQMIKIREKYHFQISYEMLLKMLKRVLHNRIMRRIHYL